MRVVVLLFRGFAAAALASLALVAGAGASDPTVSIQSDAAWIMTAQLPDGAIADQTDQQAVWPYLSNFAAMGLAHADQVTGNPAFGASAWRALHWYQAHEDANGYVTDYTIAGGVETSTGTMDSTDAYAGTFLMAVRDAWVATGDTKQLASLAPGVAGAVAAIESTQDSDGMTWAKPSWHVKYLMDQAETYGGLRAAAQIASALGNDALANESTGDADRLQAGVATLWDPATGAYDWAQHGDGVRQATNWANLYPDVLEQAWAVAFGLVPADRAQALMARIDSTHPNWDEPASLDQFDTGSHVVGYWAPVAWAFEAIGDTDRATQAAQNIDAAAVAAGRAWPFTPGDAGELAVLWSLLAPAAPTPPPATTATTATTTTATTTTVTTTTTQTPPATTTQTTTTQTTAGNTGQKQPPAHRRKG